ncbi:YecA family protein [Halanaerobium sp. MA284_MarDTE_T2]|uniref:YecA family protein n=1 Tax=Halanaerobium sp. MA284_MarDTE_T2 TaxID=2183913 RepID=UPI000E175387|nr:SEC-C metal-binding domain-containing protein [Halanaerobium sp. MA284_MarDTE_T2]RCW44411.1 SEC-C motif-containing protein [Halanaerobium sp. MA284_MarDTE_T2]
MEAGDSTTHIFVSSGLEQFATDQAAEKTIEYWENGILDFHEMFVLTLQEIGSKIGYDYLAGEKIQNMPEYLLETLIILGTIHGKKRERLKIYQDNLKKQKDARKNNIFSDLFNQSAGENFKTADETDEYFRNSDGTIIRAEEKVGRNDPCPCGSGKKYKKCCGR